MTDRRHAHAGEAATPRTVWISTELARRNPRFQIRRKAKHGAGKDAICRRGWRMPEFFDRAPVHVDRVIYFPQVKQFLDDAAALLGRKDLWSHGASLGSEQTEPDSLCLLERAPKAHEFFQVAWPIRHLPGDGAVNCDLGSPDIL